ncbi:hypothetical protein CIB48_g2157 [Xylaria polymorpha]|nr:hypothetical protein CIB48_g2157 [Xylaria polymorpha]
MPTTARTHASQVGIPAGNAAIIPVIDRADFKVAGFSVREQGRFGHVTTEEGSSIPSPCKECLTTKQPLALAPTLKLTLTPRLQSASVGEWAHRPSDTTLLPYIDLTKHPISASG